MELVMELTGCGPKEAAVALAAHKEIWLAVDSLLTKPSVSGEKYMPSKPAVDTGMDAEQQERCLRGRWMQDKVNEVFSAAHPKTQTLQDAAAPVEEQKSAQSLQPPVELSPPPSPPRGSGGQTTPPAPQSERLQ